MSSPMLSCSLAVALSMLVAACAGLPAHVAGRQVWTFDDVVPGALPPGFAIDATRRVGPLAPWAVGRAQDCPSPPNVLSKAAPNGRGHDSYNLCWNRSVSFLDGVLAVRLCARSGAEDQGGGLIWRAQGPDDYYVARCNPLESNVRLYHVVGGNRTMLASAECALRVGRWYELRIEHRDDLIRCAVDGVQKIEVTDATLLEAGGIGVWTKADAATDFDDLRIDGGGSGR